MADRFARCTSEEYRALLPGDSLNWFPRPCAAALPVKVVGWEPSIIAEDEPRLILRWIQSGTNREVFDAFPVRDAGEFTPTHSTLARLRPEPREIRKGQVWKSKSSGELRWVGEHANPVDGWELRDKHGYLVAFLTDPQIRAVLEFVSDPVDAPEPIALKSKWRNRASGATFTVVVTTVNDRYLLLGPDNTSTSWWSGGVLRSAFEEVREEPLPGVGIKFAHGSHVRNVKTHLVYRLSLPDENEYDPFHGTSEGDAWVLVGSGGKPITQLQGDIRKFFEPWDGPAPAEVIAQVSDALDNMVVAALAPTQTSPWQPRRWFQSRQDGEWWLVIQLTALDVSLVRSISAEGDDLDIHATVRLAKAATFFDVATGRDDMPEGE